jgi:Phage integrase SAM-like domain
MALKFTRLTRLSCRKLKSGEKVMEHGITFERLPDGDGRYTINIMVDGQRVHRVIGKESDGVTREQAEQFIEQARTQARQGRLNLPKGRKVVLGFRDAAEKYLERLEQEAGKDIPKKQHRFKKHLIPFFKEKPLTNISTFEVERFKKHRVEQGLKPATINRELAALSHLFSKAIEWKLIDHRPARIRRLKEGSGRISYLRSCTKDLKGAWGAALPGDIARSPEVHDETTLSPRPTISLYPAGSDDDPLSAGELGGPAGAIPAGHRSALASAVHGEVGECAESLSQRLWLAGA